MFEFLKKALKWGTFTKRCDDKENPTSLLLATANGLLEDVLLWKRMWLSLSSILFINIIFFICIHWEINFLELMFCICATIFSIDAFEAWLKYKHRTACLKRLAHARSPEISKITMNTKNLVRRRWLELMYLRETNHAKAFLLVNIFFSIIFLIGKYMSGYVFLYILCMAVCLARKIAPPIITFMKKIQQHAESDGELEGLIPEVSEVDIKILSIESEPVAIDERQSLDYWKPEDIPMEDASDSSENSSSLVTNISMDKLKTLDKDVDTSDSSEDEYIPLEQQKEQLRSTLEVVQPGSSWGSSAYNAFFSVTSAVSNVMYFGQEQTKRKRVSSIDSSDGFEIINKNDLK